jgi:hypothetical protein
VLITASSPPTELEARLHLTLPRFETKIRPMSTFTREKIRRAARIWLLARCDDDLLDVAHGITSQLQRNPITAAPRVLNADESPKAAFNDTSARFAA